MFSTITSGILSRLAWQKRSNRSATLSSLQDAIAMVEFTPEGKILTANELFLERMGYRLAEIVGQHHSIFCFCTPIWCSHRSIATSGSA